MCECVHVRCLWCQTSWSCRSWVCPVRLLNSSFRAVNTLNHWAILPTAYLKSTSQCCYWEFYVSTSPGQIHSPCPISLWTSNLFFFFLNNNPLLPEYTKMRDHSLDSLVCVFSFFLVDRVTIYNYLALWLGSFQVLGFEAMLFCATLLCILSCKMVLWQWA